MTSNQLAYQKNYETRRHNLELEREQEFSNVSQRLGAQASMASASAAQTNALANMRNAYTNRANMEINALNAQTRQYEAETGRASQQSVDRHYQWQDTINAGVGFTQQIKNVVDAASEATKIAVLGTTFG